MHTTSFRVYFHRRDSFLSTLNMMGLMMITELPKSVESAIEKNLGVDFK